MIDEQLKQLKDIYNSYFKFMSSRLIGMEHQIKKAFITFMANGHLLIEGPPGLGKTTFVKHFSNFFDLSFSRIQFTPDLMPLDIIGSNIIQEEENGKKRFVFYKGPIFANIVLADEINRATPKTQSACLEAMEEKKITFLGKTYDLPKPFMLIATQNSIDLEGTYPLPEAQVDRFFMKIYTDYPEFKILKQIVEKNEIWQVEENITNTSDISSDNDPYEKSNDKKQDLDKIQSKQQEKQAFIMPFQNLKELASLESQVVVLEEFRQMISQIVVQTHPDQTESELVKNYILYGASPRAAIALMRGAKWNALINGRLNMAFDDILDLAFDVLNHRIMLNFEGESSSVDKKGIIEDLLFRTKRTYIGN
ncbi:MAG TPA: MoxR family ATPase [Exilispira sp.]|nr:MoxR family ATPase [Spirochaetota bacterium]NLJ04994.1 MoxR family ATPase [Exilispira sp.]HOV45848.1 MoxR family ATPase [Exilispira sp.]HPB47554.1 MoxR family ATPase [Exilispira sp.]HQJ41472.1 MoxR family ATPase [Exilispira sp.]